MNKIFTFLAVACMVFTGCTEDDTLGGKYSAANVGDVISFDGTMDFKSNDKKKRTVYGQKHDDITDIKWYEGDMVRIYCEQTMDANLETGSRNFCDYEVTGDNVIGTTEDPTAEILTDGLHEVTLKNASDLENGLRWGTTSPHNFYGVYPSPKMLNKYEDDKVTANALKIENNKISAYLPNLQRPGRFVEPTTIGTNNKLYVIHPAMRYAYMVAHGQASPADGGVSLTFVPIVTAVEMILENKGENVISGVTMLTLTSDEIICGNFTSTIQGTPTITNIDTDASVKTVSVPTAADGSSITLNPGDQIKFTVFMTLNADINKLGVTITYAEGLAKKSASLTGNDVNIVQAKKKNFISTVAVNFAEVVKTIDIAHWMQALPDDTPIEGLSIPGAGGATSGTKTNNGSYQLEDDSRQQDLDIETLWANGIRCFEFFVNNGGDEGNTANFGTQEVSCNGIETGVTLDYAVDKVATLLINNPKEFAVVIIGYEEPYESAAAGQYDRNGRAYGDNFNNWWAEYPHSSRNSNVYKNRTKFKKDKILPNCTKLSDARGRLFCIGRPVSLGIDPGWYTGVYADKTQSYNCLYILGWGNNPDQWYARGYGNMVVENYVNTKTNGIPAGLNTDDRPYKIGTSKQTADATYTLKNTVSYYTDSDKGTATMSKYVYKATDWSHTNYTYTKTDRGIYNVMVQEWRRVMPTAEIQAQYDIESPEGKGFFGFNNNSREYFSAWSPSVEEKWNDVVSTFEAATHKTGNYALYINSLCGYFIDGSIALSYQPRPTFQRYFNESSAYGVYLDDKYNYKSFGNYSGMDNFDNPASGGSNTAPKTGRDVNWGPYTPAGGYQGNIAAYADWINNKFYNYLLGTTINGATGIIMMDRISNDVNTNPAGYYIPRIILANNPFPEGELLPDKKTTIPVDNNEGYNNVNDKLAAPAKRNATNEDNVSIVWE